MRAAMITEVCSQGDVYVVDVTSMRASDFAAERIREVRAARGWTAKDLAARCADIGAPEITTAVIANIETGRRDQQGRRRRDLTVDELLTLAYALEVPPVFLFLPLDGTDSLHLTQAIELDAISAAAWVDGDELALSEIYREPPPVSDEDRKRWAARLRDARPLTALRTAWMWLAMIRFLDEPEGEWRHRWQAAATRAGITDKEDYARDEVFRLAVRAIGNLVDVLSGRGLTPPPLPHTVVTALRDGSMLDHPLAYQGKLLVSDEEE